MFILRPSLSSCMSAQRDEERRIDGQRTGTARPFPLWRLSKRPVFAAHRSNIREWYCPQARIAGHLTFQPLVQFQPAPRLSAGPIRIVQECGALATSRPVSCAFTSTVCICITRGESEVQDPPYEYERALAQLGPNHRSCLMVMVSAFFFRDRSRLAELALRQRIVSMFGFREWAEAGGLLSYGPNIVDMHRRVADYVDRIAKGTKPADLPIEQPSKFEFIVNLKTARAIGIEMPTSILLRADEVIE